MMPVYAKRYVFQKMENAGLFEPYIFEAIESSESGSGPKEEEEEEVEAPTSRIR